MRRTATYESRHKSQLEDVHIIVQSFLFSKAKMKLNLKLIIRQKLNSQ